MVTVLRSHERGSEKLNALHRFHADQTLTPVRARESWGYSVHGNHVIIGTTLLENGYGGGIMKFGFLQSTTRLLVAAICGMSGYRNQIAFTLMDRIHGRHGYKMSSTMRRQVWLTIKTSQK